MSSPTQRALAYYRDLGHLCQVVETWNPHTMTRKDLYGFADVLTVSGDGIHFIQVTTTGSMSARMKKMREERLEAVLDVLAAGGIVLVMGWKKYAKKIDRKSWRPTVWQVHPGGGGLSYQPLREGRKE